MMFYTSELKCLLSAHKIVCMKKYQDDDDIGRSSQINTTKQHKNNKSRIKKMRIAIKSMRNSYAQCNFIFEGDEENNETI